MLKVQIRTILRKLWIRALCRQSMDWPYTRPRFYFLCAMCTLIERWRIVAVEQWAKIPFLSTKKVGSNFLNTRVGLHQIYVQKCAIY